VDVLARADPPLGERGRLFGRGRGVRVQREAVEQPRQRSANGLEAGRVLDVPGDSRSKVGEAAEQFLLGIDAFALGRDLLEPAAQPFDLGLCSRALLVVPADRALDERERRAVPVASFPLLERTAAEDLGGECLPLCMGEIARVVASSRSTCSATAARVAWRSTATSRA
jgi:hypothetical protein